MKNRVLMALALAAVVACSLGALARRWNLEAGDRDVAILVDFREVLPLALAAGIEPEEALARLKEKGVRGLMVSELTGDDAAHGVGLAELRAAGDKTEVSLLPGAPDFLAEWVRRRVGGSLLMPSPLNMLKTVGIVPDIAGLELAKRMGLPVYYRPAPSLGWLQTGDALLRQVADAYPVAVFTPSGEVAQGYPDLSALAAVSRERKLPVAMVEFTRQLGAGALNELAAPLVQALHSVTNEEMMARNITRAALRERLIRAAVERSVRLLLLRAAPQNMSGFALEDFGAEVAALAQGLEAQGFRLAWPKPLFAPATWAQGFPEAWALAAVLLLGAGAFACRMGARIKWGAGAAAFVIGSAGVAFLLLKFPAAARMAGALAAPLVVTEASLAAMAPLSDRSWKWGGLAGGLAGGFLVAVAGGLALAAFFSVPSYMLRLRAFSGVKLTLALPPLLVLLHDLRRRLHPESFSEILARPPLWGELMLCALLLAGLGLVLFRSGNVTFIPGFEAKVRAALERWLVARPRSKEVFIGYPSLLLLALCVRLDLWARYREVLRVGVALGFSSVVNSFCHFHTPLSLILLREFNGLWTGLILGLAAMAAVRWLLLPALRALRPLIE